MSKKNRADSQISGLSGEFFVAAELLRRGLQVSLTFGNAKSVDLLAYSDLHKQTFAIQVKSLRSKNYFFLGLSSVEKSHFYVFVLLNLPGQPVQYFIVPGEELVRKPERFGKYFTIEKMPGIHSSILSEQGYENAWAYFHALIDQQPSNRTHFENEHLVLEMIPKPNSSLDFVERFALSFDAYSFWGDQLSSAMESDCECLSHLRTKLFMEQHAERDPNGINIATATPLITAIANLVSKEKREACKRPTSLSSEEE